MWSTNLYGTNVLCNQIKLGGWNLHKIQGAINLKYRATTKHNKQVMFAHTHPSYSHMAGSDFTIYKNSPHVKTGGGGKCHGHEINSNDNDIHNCSHIISTSMQAVLTEIFSAKSWKLKFLLWYVVLKSE